MHHRLFRLAAVTAGLTVAATAVGTASAAALPLRARVGAAPVAATRTAAAQTAVARTAKAGVAKAGVAKAGVAKASVAKAAPRTIVLINGNKIFPVATSSGTRFGGVIAATRGIAGTLLTLRLDGKTYEIPAVAMPYLGRGLDPSLFDVSALIGRETGGRLPVRVGFQGRPPALPGVQVTHKGSAVEDGYLTASSAKKFGAALDRQFRADHSRGHYGGAGLFAHGVAISLAGAASQQATRPGFVQNTLTVRGTELTGKPDNGDLVSVFNVDNGSLFADPIETTNDFFDGVSKFSVPAGHYCAIGMFFDVSAQTPALRIVVLPQFSAGRGTSVGVDERAATSEVTMVTPRPAIAQTVTIEIRRAAAIGSTDIFSIGAEGLPLWINPTSQKPTVGGLQTFTDGLLTSPSGQAVPYEYDLAFAGPNGIIPPQHFVVRAARLARVDASYYSAVPMTGFFGRSGLFTTQIQDGFIEIDLFPLTLPQQRIEYTSVGGGLVWTALLTTGPGDVLQLDGFRQYRARERVREDWNRYPLHVGVNADLVGAAAVPFFSLPSAARAGDTLSLDVTPFSDNLPGHEGNGFGFDSSGARVTGSFEIDQNGKKIAGATVPVPSSPDLFIPAVTLSPKPSALRFVVNAARAGQQYPLSTRSQTSWTWDSSHEAGATLPGGWICAGSYVTGVLERNCAVEPLLALRYSVGGLALDGSVAAGRQVLDLSASHLQLAHAARVTGATVAVSFDDGKTWHQAGVSRRHGSGNFRAVFTAPAPGSGTTGYVTLRVTATDAGGGAIEETITRAYKIAP